MANRKSKIVAVSYDSKGNVIDVPQNYDEFYGITANRVNNWQAPVVDVGNHQSVQVGLNTGSNYNQPTQYQPFFAFNQNPGPDPTPPTYSRNEDGSFSINTDYINQNLTGGKRGFDAYGTYDRNTNREYAYEGIYGNRGNLNSVSIFGDGGSLPNKKANNGTSFNNPFTDDRQFNYGSSMDYMKYANQGPNQPLQPLQSAPYQMMPVDNTPPQGQPMSTLPSQQQSTGSNYGSTASGIQSGVEAVGGIFSGINNLRNQVIMGGGALINGLLKDQHNVRNKPPVLADQTLAYQPQYNNMLANGGMMQNPGFVVNTAYQPDQIVDLSPEEVQKLKEAGYTFEVLE